MTTVSSRAAALVVGLCLALGAAHAGVAVADDAETPFVDRLLGVDDN